MSRFSQAVPGASAASRPHYCLVLSWPFTITGGVNHVVNGLMHRLQGDESCYPLALELQWDATIPEDTLPSGVQRFYFRLRPPYIRERPLASVIAFLLVLPRTLRWLRRLACDYRICIFNAFFPDLTALNFVLLKTLRLFRGKTAVSFQGSDIRTACQTKGVERFLWKLLLRRVDIVVACSEGLKTEVLMLEKRARVVVYHNAIDVDLFIGRADPDSTYPPQVDMGQVVLSVASFEYRKGHDITLRAFQKIAGRHPHASLVLVGAHGPVIPAIRRMVEESGIAERIHILEDLPHVRIYGLLSRASVFVLASRWRKGLFGEGFPNVILEAAAAKTPVVSTATCGAAEIIENGVTGCLVPLEDPAALADAICCVLEDPQAARQRAEKLLALVRERFTWDRVAEQYRGLCDSF
jgi:glycosyltransferase involved in cell wall biosynthesis